jgi:uncharacterized surface protein with fasciclin (FAS1) repeats
VLAPTKDPNAAIKPEDLDRLRSDPEAADALLRDLIVAGDIAGSGLTPGPLTTVGGGTIEIARDGASVTAGGATVTPDAIEASNGIVHALATVPTIG